MGGATSEDLGARVPNVRIAHLLFGCALTVYLRSQLYPLRKAKVQVEACLTQKGEAFALT